MAHPKRRPGPSSDAYQALVQSIDGIVWAADARTFRFTFISPQVERILGYSPRGVARRSRLLDRPHRRRGPRVGDELLPARDAGQAGPPVRVPHAPRRRLGGLAARHRDGRDRSRPAVGAARRDGRRDRAEADRSAAEGSEGRDGSACRGPDRRAGARQPRAAGERGALPHPGREHPPGVLDEHPRRTEDDLRQPRLRGDLGPPAGQGDERSALLDRGDPPRRPSGGDAEARGARRGTLGGRVPHHPARRLGALDPRPRFPGAGTEETG